MNNMNELINKISNILSKDELKSAILNAMNNTNRIEELLILYWHFGKYFFLDDIILRNSIFSKNVERISYEKALANRNVLIEDILSNCSLDKIMEKYNITRESIKRVVISYLESKNYDEAILEKIDVLDEHFVPEHDRAFICAVTAFKIFIDNNCLTIKEIYNKFSCPDSSFRKYLNILETREHSLYKQYSSLSTKYINIKFSNNNQRHQKERIIYNEEISKINSLNSKEILEVLSNTNSSSFVNFCIYYGFDTTILIEMLKADEGLKFELANNKEFIADIYNKYIGIYKVLINDVIKEIILLSREKFAKPLDLYEYYEKTRFDVKALARISSNFSGIKNATLIQQYLDKFPTIFENIDRKDIVSLRQKCIITCCKDSITFTNSDLSKALRDIEEKRLPISKGLLYSSIKRQIELRNDKVKRLM